MRLISFTYRHCKGGLILPGTLANNREAGTGYLDTHIPPGTLVPCLENMYSLDKSRLTKAEIMNQLSKSNPPLPIKLQGRDIVSPKGRPRYLNLPTGKTEGEKT
jgi:hypothetical protein